MNLAQQLRLEIVRLSARTARQVLGPIQRSTAAHRRQIAALRKQVGNLERELKLQRVAAKQAASETKNPDKVRFVAKGLISLRKRLGLSAADLGRLIGVTGQTIYAWESKKTTPRKAQVTAIAALRNVGKREAMARLEVMSRKT